MSEQTTHVIEVKRKAHVIEVDGEVVKDEKGREIAVLESEDDERAGRTEEEMKNADASRRPAEAADPPHVGESGGSRTAELDPGLRGQR